MQNLGEDLALDCIEQATRAAMDVEDRPSLIICRTHIAPGSPNKQDTHGAHGAPLGTDEVRLTKQAYGWPSDEPFHVPDAALEHSRACVDRGRAWHAGGWSAPVAGTASRSRTTGRPTRRSIGPRTSR